MADEQPDEIRPLRLSGGRFDLTSKGEVVGFPLSAARELARYDDLILDVAKRLWHGDHPSQRQVPRDFEKKVRLQLVDLEKGSVSTVLKAVRAPGPISAGIAGYGDRARALVVTALIAFGAGDGIPREFPPDSLDALARFAKSLQDNEVAILPDEHGNELRYRKADQQRLHQYVAQTRPRSGDVLGLVTAIDPDRGRFTFRLRDGRKVEGHFAGADVEAALHGVTRSRHVAPYVVLDCDYSIDASDRAVAIDAVRSVVEVSRTEDPLAPRLRELAELPHNWDGNGAHPAAIPSLQLAQAILRECDALDAPLPHAFLTHEGGVLLEDQPDLVRWSLEIEPDGEMMIVIAGGGRAPEYGEPSTPAEAASSLKEFYA
ncbi:MAG: hypothetical protein WC558_09635 [Patulibacter sp.]